MTLQIIFLALETVLMFLFLTSLPIVCSGNIAGAGTCLCLMVVTANWDKFISLISRLWQHTGGKITLIAVATIIFAGLIYVTSLSVLMLKARNNKPEKPNVIVVLGCKVNGETPSRMLRRRLDTAIEEMNEFSDVKCIVSGGQGENEKISESSAMKKYLVENGIDESRIIVEDKSTSTYENIKFSLEKLDELGMSHDMTLVTDGFHEYRAGLIAKAQGIENVTACSAQTEPRYVLTYWVREWLGITHFYVFGN